MYLCQLHITIIKVGTDVSVKLRRWGIIHRLKIECVTNSLGMYIKYVLYYYILSTCRYIHPK